MTKISEARTFACRMWPHATFAIMSMTVVETRQVSTMAVDRHWRLYYNPDFLSTLTIKVAAGIILHEVKHLLHRHHKRAHVLIGNEADRVALHQWNIAADCSVNEGLRAEGVELTEGACYPEMFKFPKGKRAEVYYGLLREMGDQSDSIKIGKPGANTGGGQSDDSDGARNVATPGQPSAQNDDSQGDGKADPQGEPGTGQGSASQDGPGQPAEPQGDPQGLGGGSCADGVQRPWELGEPTEKTGGLDEGDANIVIRKVAEQVAKSIGAGRGGDRLLVEEIIKPRTDPRTAIMRAVKRFVDQVTGHGDYSYRRPSRRSPPGIILPAQVQPVPRISIVVDTSGSMACRKRLGVAVGLVGRVINSMKLRDGVKVLCGDAGLQSVSKVFDPRQIDLKGGGGTDMTKMIEEALQQQPTPQLVIVCTDAETHWPKEPTAVPVLACVAGGDDYWIERIPKWINTVVLEA